MLREPLGKYKVAIWEYDTDYIEGKEKRKIPMMFYYPSNCGSKMCPYKDVLFQKARLKGNMIDNGVKTYCYSDGTLSSEIDKYPVIIYSHGLTGFQMESTVLCADLASNGFIVVSIGHPFGSGAVTYTDGTMFDIPEDSDVDIKDLKNLGLLWEEDIFHVIRYLKKIQNGDIKTCFSGRLDIENGVNLLGVSFGGCCSIGALLKEQQAKCAINLDGNLFIDLEPTYTDKPILVLCSPLNHMAYFKLKKISYPHLSIKKIRKVTHWEFSDGVYLSDKGKNNRQWAYDVSSKRANLCLELIVGA